MENSVESDCQPIVSPPRRRRSTFFERRESLATETRAPTTSKCSNEDTEETEALKQYYNSLVNEEKEWKNELRLRGNIYKELKMQLENIVNDPSTINMCYAALNDEDIKFLNQKLDISKIIESGQALHTSLKVTKSLYATLMDLETETLKDCKDQMNKINDYILDNSTIDTVVNK